MKHICIIGAGSWGTALALTAHRAGQQVTLIPREAAQAALLNQFHENRHYLPGVSFPSHLTVSSELEQLAKADIVLQVTPAQSLPQLCLKVQPYLPAHIPWVICAKGIIAGELGKHARLLSEVSQDLLPNPVVILSGPSFAEEVGQNLPAAVTVASEQVEAARLVAASLRHTHFRCYINDDPAGVQVAGAVKNVLAIACGIVRGKGLGSNAVAALLTRGLAEMRRLGIGLGGRKDTFFGLAGVGDVTLTCSSTQSRNMRLGKALGQGQNTVAKILESTSFTTEGVPTVAAIHKIAKALSITMPICQGVYDLLYKGISLENVMGKILSHQSDYEF